LDKYEILSQKGWEPPVHL